MSGVFYESRRSFASPGCLLRATLHCACSAASPRTHLPRRGTVEANYVFRPQPHRRVKNILDHAPRLHSLHGACSGGEARVRCFNVKHVIGSLRCAYDQICVLIKRN
jgi:hypothetical protein